MITNVQVYRHVLCEDIEGAINWGVQSIGMAMNMYGTIEPVQGVGIGHIDVKTLKKELR